MPAPMMDRRTFLASGAGIAGAAVLGASALGCADDRVHPLMPSPNTVGSFAKTDAGRDLIEPAVIASVGGLLSASIVCDTRPVNIAGRMVLEPVTYNGSFPGPTLWCRPGDAVDVRFTNRIVFDQADSKPGYGRPPRHANMTNLHYHGLHVSPAGSADNMTVMVPANGTHRYQFRIPDDHPGGLFWYHAHVHGLVTNQVGRGAAGMIYIANGYTDQIGSSGTRRRLMMLQQAYLDIDEKTLTAGTASGMTRFGHSR